MNRIDKLARMARMFLNYKKGTTVLPYPPLRMWVETTNQCNLRCTFCPNAQDTISKRGDMDMELFKSIVDQAAGRVNDFNLSHRGEPLFHPELESMIGYAGDHGIGTRIHTNATMLDADRRRQLLDARPDLVSFSFDGYDKATYESTRIGGNFEETHGNIRRFLEEKKRLNAALPYTIIQIIQPPDATHEYLENLRNFGNLFESQGLDKFYIKKAHNWAGNAPGASPDSVSFSLCTFLYYSMTVLWDGTVCPCPQDWYGTMPLGNLNQQSLMDVWNGEPLAAMRRRMRNRDLTGLLCSECDRVFRPSVMGVPTENLKAFFGETVAGYRLVRKLIRR